MILIFVLLFSIPALVLVCSLFILFGWELLLLPNPNPEGDWVAEVWSMWYYGRGSNLFCQRYSTKEDAVKAAKRAAKISDKNSSTHYKCSYRDGRVYYEEHKFGISWGVIKMEKIDISLFKIIPLPLNLGNR